MLVDPTHMGRASCWQEHRAEDVLPLLSALKLRKTGRGHGEDTLKDAPQIGSNFPMFSVPPPPKNHHTDNSHPNYNRQKYHLDNIWKLKHTRFVLLSNNTWINTAPQFFDILIHFEMAFSSEPPRCFCWMSTSQYSKDVSYCFKQFTAIFSSQNFTQFFFFNAGLMLFFLSPVTTSVTSSRWHNSSLPWHGK